MKNIQKGHRREDEDEGTQKQTIFQLEISGYVSETAEDPRRLLTPFHKLLQI